jgi:chromosome segregation protein
MAGLKLVLEKIHKDVPELEKELSQLSGSRQDIADEIKQLRTAVNSEKHELYELVQRRNALDQDKNRLSVEINSSVYERSQLDIQIHNLENELSLVDYDYEPVELDDVEEISKRINALEAEKARLEPVNMRAIEAYEEQEEKFNYYKERRDKVMEERESILQFMAEIETKKKQVFMEAFNHIAENFSLIFAKLSPGGMGKLLLEDYEDPFAGGLEIEAKPAGKEVAVIDSMSGGEKALTALAFIFAVQAYKPSPFYILDEIDAHLDDDNVKRVAELVAETSKGSQFVVVTLRDSMMAQANELIGVSMEESGVSKCVGVRMEAGRLVEEGTGAEEAQAGGAEA